MNTTYTRYKRQITSSGLDSMYNKIDDERIFYKSLRIISGKLRHVIIDEYGNIVDNNPTKEQIELAIPDWKKDKYKGSECCMCGSIDTYTTPNGHEEWYGHRCNKKYCTRYLCRNCWQKGYNKNNRYCRNKNLDPDSTTGKGYITEVLVAKFLGIKTCFDITGNFNHKAFDMYEDKHFGRINVKGSSLLLYCDGHLEWYFHTDKNIIPDFFFCIGYDEYMKNIKCVYIIPNEDRVRRLAGIRIYKDGRSKWNVFRESEEEVKKWNELFHTLKLDNCPVLRNIGSKDTLEKKKIRSYKERMREKYKRDILETYNND